jgi:hypothetical protein
MSCIVTTTRSGQTAVLIAYLDGFKEPITGYITDEPDMLFTWFSNGRYMSNERTSSYDLDLDGVNLDAIKHEVMQ